MSNVTPVLRVVTLNLWGATEPLAERMALAAGQLRALAPDVVLLQEVARTGQRTTADELAETLSMRAEVADTGEAGMGLAVLSREPVAERALLELPSGAEPRALLSARLAGKPAWVHSCHLEHRLDAGIWRERQVVAIAERIAALSADAVHVLCGDFNAVASSAEMRFLCGLNSLSGKSTSFQDAWQRHHPGEPGYTWCTQTGEARRRRSIDVDRRVDYALVSPRQRDGSGTVVDCRLVMGERDAGGRCASDHYGLMVEVELASGTPSRQMAVEGRPLTG